MIAVPDTVVEWFLATTSTIVLGLSSGGFLFLRGRTIENANAISTVRETLYGEIEKQTDKVEDASVSVVYCAGVQKEQAQVAVTSQLEHKQIADVLKEIKVELKDIRKEMRGAV